MRRLWPQLIPTLPKYIYFICICMCNFICIICFDRGFHLILAGQHIELAVQPRTILNF